MEDQMPWNSYEKNIGRTYFDTNHNSIFLDPPPRVVEIKTKMNK